MHSRQQIIEEKIKVINQLNQSINFSTDWIIKNILGIDSVADFRKAKIKKILNEIKF